MQAISSAPGGLQQAEDLLNRTANHIAQAASPATAPTDQVSLSDDAVSLLQAKNSYAANLDSIKVADDMLKSTLSLLA